VGTLETANVGSEHQNAVVYLVRTHNYRNQVLLVKKKYSKKWTTPGGIRDDNKDTNDFSTMKREFKEETGHAFPLSSAGRIEKLSYNLRTAVFVAALDSPKEVALGEPVRFGPSKDDEMIDIRWFDIASLLGDEDKWPRYIHRHTVSTLRDVLKMINESHFI
jgi:8-oxo-dGTP pyrophosphatase MutT (NUDIX family)